MEEKRIKYGSEIIDEFLTEMEQDTEQDASLTKIIKVIKQIRQSNKPLTDTRLAQELEKLRKEEIGS